MQGLPQLEEHEVGDIDQIVLGVDARGAQAVLHPLRRRAYFAVLHRHARVAGGRFVVLDADGHRQVMVVGSEGRDVGHLHFGVQALTPEVSRQIARHADMRRGIDAVGGESHLNQVVVLDAEVFFGRHTDAGVGRKFHNAVMRGPDAQFVLGAKHAERLHAADLAAFDLEFLVAAAGVEHRADRGAEHLQPGPAVGRAADDLQGITGADIDRREVQVVRIGMVRAGQHLADHDAVKPALYGLDLLETLDFESDVGQYPCDFFGRKIGVEIAFKPVIRNIHN